MCPVFFAPAIRLIWAVGKNSGEPLAMSQIEQGRQISLQSWQSGPYPKQKHNCRPEVAVNIPGISHDRSHPYRIPQKIESQNT
jgi:hypothetical protein